MYVNQKISLFRISLSEFLQKIVLHLRTYTLAINTIQTQYSTITIIIHRWITGCRASSASIQVPVTCGVLKRGALPPHWLDSYTDYPDSTPEQQTEVKLHKYFTRQTAVASMPYSNHLNMDTGWSMTLSHTHTLSPLNTRS